jgi:citrate lyase subunit beta/citryl-CoA lyase
MPVERSFLFVPGDRPERFAKALAAGADRVVVDLEDAVLPDAKSAARDNVASWCAGAEAAEIAVRINGSETAWSADDLRLVAALSNVTAVILPKAEDRAVIEAIASRLGRQQRLVALVETVRGYLNRHEIARSRGVTRMAFGSVDFCTETGIRGLGSELDPVRVELVIASAAAGLAPPVEGVTIDIRSETVLAQDVDRARRLGFGGKLCIHPSQVGAVNEGFAPGEDEIRWAERVVAASRSSGATTVDGRLVDKPVIEQARRVLASTR